MKNNNLLFIDDEIEQLQVLKDYFAEEGYLVDTATNSEESLKLVQNKEYSVSIIDINLIGSEANGLEVAQKIKDIHKDIEIIILTGLASLEKAIEAIRIDVFDFLCKPEKFSTLARCVRNASERRLLRIQNRELLKELELERKGLKNKVKAAGQAIAKHLDESPAFIGQSERIQTVRDLVAEVSPSDLTVFIRGESGTGKDVVANLIHEWSGRRGNFIKINCPAISETLLESEMFGHEKGAFTGAVNRKPGRVEMANGGTLFLDEIGTISPAFQAKLLQFIEHKKYTRIGGFETHEIDVRIIAATNAPIEKMVENNEFRTDLIYRLSQFIIVLPPLRERREDIPLLVEHFLNHYCPLYGHKNYQLSSSIMSDLVEYDWLGNVRELKALIERFAIKCNIDTIKHALNGNKETVYEKKFMDDEKKRILSALIETKWNRRKAAQLLGMSYSTLRRKIELNKLDSQKI
jgi:two-component system NtrC family response regulator